jgi:hypothetical protein
MGCVLSVCRRSAQEDILDQYENLVVSKPAPINLEAIQCDNSQDTDVPLFAEVKSGSDGNAIPSVGSGSDEYVDFQSTPPPKHTRKLD